jgi:hypothetical protein
MILAFSAYVLLCGGLKSGKLKSIVRRKYKPLQPAYLVQDNVHWQQFSDAMTSDLEIRPQENYF